MVPLPTLLELALKIIQHLPQLLQILVEAWFDQEAPSFHFIKVDGCLDHSVEVFKIPLGFLQVFDKVVLQGRQGLTNITLKALDHWCQLLKGNKDSVGVLKVSFLCRKLGRQPLEIGELAQVFFKARLVEYNQKSSI